MRIMVNINEKNIPELAADLERVDTQCRSERLRILATIGLFALQSQYSGGFVAPALSGSHPSAAPEPTEAPKEKEPEESSNQEQMATARKLRSGISIR